MDGLNEAAKLRRQIQADIIGLQYILDHTKNNDSAVEILDKLTKHKRSMMQLEASNEPSLRNRI